MTAETDSPKIGECTSKSNFDRHKKKFVTLYLLAVTTSDCKLLFSQFAFFNKIYKAF